MSNLTKRYMQSPPQYPYDWFSPLRSDEVVAGKITSFGFMGHPLIAFRDDTGKVVVLDAHCPHFGAHRGASGGGRVENGCVRCPFHGLHFDGTGQCVKGDFVADQKSLRNIKSTPWTVHEVAASIFVWHGPNRERPDRPLRLAEPGFFDGWSTPITNMGRPLPSTNLMFPSENIVDTQHFYAIHNWKLYGVTEPPAETKEGAFSATMLIHFEAGAQSPYALVRRLGKIYSSDFEFNPVIHGPGVVVATSKLGPDQGSLELRSLILITPVSPTDCHLRVVSSVKQRFTDPLSKLARRVLGVGIEDLLARVFLAIATKDFDGDEMIWSRRKFLSNPKLLPEDGPVVAFRRWYERFWPADYLPEASA